MDDLKAAADGERKLKPYLSPLGAFALALGCAVGQGAFLMPGRVFLPIGGPLGTAIGMLLGAGVMLIIAGNYHYLVNRYPDAGGAFTYAKKILGYDHGFLTAWFLLLAYVAVLWANTTAVPVILRYLVGDFFQVGDYAFAGQKLYLGEVGVALVALLAACLLCMKKSFGAAVQIICALALCVTVALAFVLVFEGRPLAVSSFEPLFSTKIGWGLGILNLVALAPWAFVGFEGISNSAAEFRFDRRKTWRILALAVGVGTALYVMLTLIAISTLPAGCETWSDYILNLSEERFQTTNAARPTFFGMFSALGEFGRALFAIGGLGAVLTGIIGNYIAASRLLFAMADDQLLPGWFGRLNRDHAPRNALLFILAVSLFLPFFGRTAISWIVDVTTIGATIVYGYTSAATWFAARAEYDRRMAVCGCLGTTISALFLFFLIVPGFLEITTLSTESYFILAAWSIIGAYFFRHEFINDTAGRLGRSIVVWIVLLALIFFASVMWMYESTEHCVKSNIEPIERYYQDELNKFKLVRAQSVIGNAHGHLLDILDGVRKQILCNILIQIGIISVALGALFSIFKIMQGKEKQLELDKQMAEEVSRAKTNFLSNMSHEIRTPMNAIIGLDNIALRDPELPPKIRAHLEKIGSSAHHLLGLINDILDMSRIESGRMVLKNEEFSFRDFLEQINVIINGQCADKGLAYSHPVKGSVDDYYVGDDMKLKQVLINVLGNAVKFTPPPGKVTFTTEESARFEGYRTLTFRIEDTGIGIDKDYLPRIFEAFSQEDATTTNLYGGSGLGMSITRSLVQMMDGDIKVESEKGRGTTFIVKVTLKASSRSLGDDDPSAALTHLRVLLVDDDPVTLDHAKLELATLGIAADACPNAAAAALQVRDRRAQGAPYHFLLTDLKMPEMSGLELTRAIREFDGGETAVIIMTGYDFDANSAAAKGAGIDGFLYKPLFSNSLRREFLSVMHKRGIDLSDDAKAPAAPLGASLEGRKVLIAEDVDLNAEILADLLEIEGVSCERAENGAVALKLFADSAPNHYDAVLMDMRMPEMDGLAATRAIRALDRPDAKTVPIVAMTANAFEDDVQRSLQAGLNAHLAKPVEPERLYEVLRLLIAGRDAKG